MEQSGNPPQRIANYKEHIATNNDNNGYNDT